MIDLQGLEEPFLDRGEPKREPLAGRVVSIDALRGSMMFWIIGTWADFAHAVAGFAIVWLILFWMYRKKTFIKV